MKAYIRDKDTYDLIAVLTNLKMVLTVGSRLRLERNGQTSIYTITGILYDYNMDNETQYSTVYVKEWY